MIRPPPDGEGRCGSVAVMVSSAVFSLLGRSHPAAIFPRCVCWLKLHLCMWGSGGLTALFAKLWARVQTLSCVPLLISCPAARHELVGVHLPGNCSQGHFGGSDPLTFSLLQSESFIFGGFNCMIYCFSTKYII